MLIYEILKSFILGIIQGITEWLPISSTGHMILFDELIPMRMSAEFMDMYFVVIQLASIIAVIIIYFHRLNPFAPRKSQVEKKATWETWFKVIVGIIPVGIIGFFLDDIITEHFYNWQVVAFTLILYGVLFILIENHNKNKKAKFNSVSQMSYGDAFKIGLFQILSLIPGTSRSGSTIMGGLISGASRSAAADFSFFMSIPVMLGASALKLSHFGWQFTSDELLVLAVGMLTSFIVSYFAIKFLLRYIQNNDFKVFAYYRIILGIIVILTFSLFN